jgi:adenosylcobinamide-GDP ribazoletransferase
MKRFLCAIAFLTRFPIPPSYNFGAEDVGKSTLFFPLVGIGLGAVQLAFLQLLKFGGVSFDTNLKAILAAILLLIINALATGALHFDGLADMADGFGGGCDKEKILLIMRDSLIGSYGATALILLILLKVTAIAALIQTPDAQKFLILAPMFGRWATVPFGKFMPYARTSGGLGNSVTDYVGWTEIFGATLIVLGAIFFLSDWKNSLICWLIVCLTTVYVARLCLKKIGGVTGDTLGANTEICEAFVLLTAVFLTK